MNERTPTPWWHTVVVAAMAGGMGWGIRGQYGHETGAMIAGLLVCLVIALTLCRHTTALAAARAVALGTIAMGFGGTETYGQTIGLTKDAPYIGDWGMFAWGMLGLAVKGSLWIGFCGAFLGLGLGGRRYRSYEMLVLMIGALAAYALGVYLLNSPFDPQNHRLPAIYFSKADDPRPRFEAWGGLWFALIWVMVYAGAIRRDGLAWRLGLWGVLGGALGFPLGECIQSYHAWNPEVFQSGIWTTLGPVVNWWNMMETTFGFVMGALLGLGAWIHRARIQPLEYEAETRFGTAAEWTLWEIHAALLILSEFVGGLPAIEVIYDLGLIMGIIPLIGIVGGRWWPYLTIFPVTLLPIAGKTIRNLVYEEHAISPVLGWILYGILPMAAAMAMVIVFTSRWKREPSVATFCGAALLFSAWVYFLLNYAFFRFPWPWQEWTGRTPNAIIFAVFLAGQTVLAIVYWRKRTAPPASESAV